MKRMLLTALALTLAVCVLAAAQAATVMSTGAYGVEGRLTIEPRFAYRISSSDLSFEFGDAAQTLTLELTESILYGGDAVRVTAPVSVTLTEAENGRTLPVNFTTEGATDVPTGDTAVYDFDENGMLALSVAPDWTGAMTGAYTGEAKLTLAVESASGFDYDGTAASSVEITLPIRVNVDYCIVTVFVGEGGSVKTSEAGEPVEIDDQRRCEFVLGRTETAALYIVPDAGYAVGDVLIDPDEDWVTRDGDRIVFTEIRSDTRVTISFVPAIVSIELDEHLIEFTPGGVTEHTLSATIAPDAARDAPVSWTSSDADVATVEAGVVRIPEDGRCGSTLIRCAAKYDAEVYAECAVIVHSISKMVLPGAIEVIGEEAFAGIAATEFILPKGIRRIEARAFAGSAAKLVQIMNKDVELDERAFEGCEDVTLFCPKGSRVADFAQLHDLRCVLYDES